MDNFVNYDRIVKDLIFEIVQDEMDILYLGIKLQYLGMFVVKMIDIVGMLCWLRLITPSQQFDSASYVNYKGETIAPSIS